MPFLRRPYPSSQRPKRWRPRNPWERAKYAHHVARQQFKSRLIPFRELMRFKRDLGRVSQPRPPYHDGGLHKYPDRRREVTG